MPIKDKFCEGNNGYLDGKTITKRPYEWHNRIYINMEYGSCHIWEGKPEHYTSYA